MKLVLASNNAKKLAELQALFDGLGVELVRQGELGVTEAEEPHVTFIENALAKARHAAAATGLPAIADDSGLCVDALGGMPGVISAHYAAVARDAGEAREASASAQDEANNALLLEKLRGRRRPPRLLRVHAGRDPLGRRSAAAGGGGPLERRDPARARRRGRLRLRPVDVHPGVRRAVAAARPGRQERAQPPRDRGARRCGADARGMASLKGLGRSGRSAPAVAGRR